MTTEQIEVLKRAGARRLVLALVVLAVALVPLVALGAANDWWFLRFGGAPVPTTAPQVVQEGEWNGHPWQLTAFPSATHGLCVSVTPKGSVDDGEGGAMSCGSFVGVRRMAETKPTPAPAITVLAGGATEQLPAYIAGAVIGRASVVEVRFPEGRVLRVPTVAGPEPLEHIRFYMVQLPAGFRLTPENTARVFPSWIAGTDASGTVVACVVPRAAGDGTSSLSDCR